MITVLIAMTGGLGAALRFWADAAIRDRWQPALPVATITINTAGSLLVGVLAGLLSAGAMGALASVLSIGLCGGFTTFSTAMVESARLLLAGDRGRCFANLVITMALTLAAVALGFGVASTLAG